MKNFNWNSKNTKQGMEENTCSPRCSKRLTAKAFAFLIRQTRMGFKMVPIFIKMGTLDYKMQRNKNLATYLNKIQL